jgi:cytochrome c oxidase assembly protein Cox11
MEYGRLVVGGVLGGDAVQLLKHAPEEAAFYFELIECFSSRFDRFHLNLS